MELSGYVYAAITGGFGLIATLIGWLLANKDAKQQAEITKLFELHDKDAAELAALKLLIAGNHYERKELDERFRLLNDTIKDGFKELGVDIKDMTKAVTQSFKDHVTEYHSKDHKE